MNLKAHFEMLAGYNQWMNSKVYEAAGRLDEEELSRDRGAFFGSILGTLNHILVADTIWLKRFAAHSACRESLREVVELPNPTRLNQLLFKDFTALSEHRGWMDDQIIHWIDNLSEADLDVAFSYHNIKGVPAYKQFSSLVLHFFNHQTHHRGQVSTLLSQAGEDIGVTDLLARIPNETNLDQ